MPLLLSYLADVNCGGSQVLATEVETEEEFLVNNLQKRLQKLTQEKVALESQLETENEYVTNQLTRKVGCPPLLSQL
jgi:iron-sulfur cluster repair protein YtfE (RIC family)